MVNGYVTSVRRAAAVFAFPPHQTMPITLTCSGCGKTLRVPDADAGKQARCPICKTVQPIPHAAPAAEPPAATPPPEIPRQPPPPPAGNPYAAPPRQENPYASPAAEAQNVNPATGRSYKPHRAGGVLALGIMALLCNVCLVPGIAAWAMAHEDLKQMDAGIMDPSGRGMTQAGMVLGIIGTVLYGLSMAINFLGAFR